MLNRKMSSYIRQTLLSCENLRFWVRPHWVIFLLPIIFILLAWSLLISFAYLRLLSQLILLLGFFKLIQAIIFYCTSEYGITNKRVLIKVGWIRRASLEIYLNRVESIQINQSVLGRLLNYGSIRVVGIGGSSDFFPYVPAPIQFRKEVQKAITGQTKKP